MALIDTCLSMIGVIWIFFELLSFILIWTTNCLDNGGDFILPLILLHGLTDFFAFLALNSSVQTTGMSMIAVVVTAGEIVIYTIYCFILMRQVKPQTLGADTGAKLNLTPAIV